MAGDSLRLHRMIPGEPMWNRVPTRDEQGRSLHDFMMLIPKVGRWPEARRQQTLQCLGEVINEFDEQVVFADLNLKLNLLWISMRPAAGGCSPLVTAIRARVPEAVLVANQYEVMVGQAERQGATWNGWLKRLALGCDWRR